MFILKAENTKKAGHNVKPRPTCENVHLDLCCAESACHRSNNEDLYTTYHIISEYNKAFGASWCVHSAHGVCVLQNTLVYNIVYFFEGKPLYIQCCIIVSIAVSL